MDALDALSARARHLGGFSTTEGVSDGSSESNSKGGNEDADEITRAYRLLQLVKLLLVIIATGLTIGQMLVRL